MFEQLLNFLNRATTVAPSYTPEHCLVVSKSVGSCSICADTCPHQAIEIGREVVIDDVECTGCGLCVQACPSQALETPLNYRAGEALKCSQVSGSAQSIQCLTRLQASDILRLAGRGRKVTLARADCADCPVGTAEVEKALEGLIVEAESLAGFMNRPLAVEIRLTESLEAAENPEVVSRRQLLRGGWHSLQRGAADALAPFDPGDDEDADLPKELQRRYALIEQSRPEPEALVPWVLPSVGDGCIMCPVCTNVCPTDAFEREFNPMSEGGGATLWLDPERCNGCGACESSCPVKVITLEAEVRWSELGADKLRAYERSPSDVKPGSIARE